MRSKLHTKEYANNCGSSVMDISPSIVSSLVSAILTGRTDLCVSAVFVVGKTRAAAALIAGLMVMTKENTAKAFTDHLLSLKLPESVYARARRIVGYLEAKKGASHKTKLDIEHERRDVLARRSDSLDAVGGSSRKRSKDITVPRFIWPC